jgi:hypothetical protein
MADNRARNYIERLPEIIERDEQDLSHLDPEMIAILYPARAPREFTVSVVFGPPPESEDPGAEGSYQRAVAIAQKSRGYRVEGKGRYLRHSAVYGIDDVQKLHDVFQLVGDFPSCEILVKGRRVPLARELWLPFFWFFKKDQ